MPSHIFVQHGMWNRVSASNDVAYNASAKWVDRKNLSITKRDYHSLEWKAYADLQRGVYGDVLDAIAIVDDAVKETDDNRLRRISSSMVARHAIEDRPLRRDLATDGRRGYEPLQLDRQPPARRGNEGVRREGRCGRHRSRRTAPGRWLTSGLRMVRPTRPTPSVSSSTRSRRWRPRSPVTPRAH